MTDSERRTLLNSINTDTRTEWIEYVGSNPYVGVESTLPLSGQITVPVSSPMVLRKAGALVKQMDSPTSGDQAKAAEALDRLSEWRYLGMPEGAV